jgi:hypothetical protein
VHQQTRTLRTFQKVNALERRGKLERKGGKGEVIKTNARQDFLFHTS